MNRESIEIMAPVGSFESLHAAIQGGANSVYFGIEHLNMRSRSSANFTTQDLEEIVRICNEHGIKSYLTLNTIIFDNDIVLMKEILETAKRTGLSAVIAADQAVITYANSIGVEVHLSTQLNITNYETLKFYANYADVVVLARELNMDQVAHIKSQILRDNLTGPSGKQIRIEMFVHGALCMAVSGKCYLSLHETNTSANRGGCTQVCRRGYTVKEKELGFELDIDNEYIMSPKDLKTVHFLNKILASGVEVLKLEGRARSPEYVKTVVQCYSEAVEAVFDGTYTEEKIAEWDNRLATVFNRGFWDGYYLGQRLGEWSHNYGSSATTRKMLIGKCTNYFTKLDVAEFLLESNTLSVGDNILVTGPTTGVVEAVVEEIRVDLKPVEKAVKGDSFSIKLDQRIRRADKLYKVVNANDIQIQ